MDSKFAGLKPGHYLMTGDRILPLKSLQTWDSFTLPGADAVSDVAELAQVVSWVFIALEKRASHLAQIAYEWRRGEDAIDDEDIGIVLEHTDPLMSARALAARIDEALQTYGVAYLYKLRAGAGRGRGRFLGFQWFDPETITPWGVAGPDGGAALDTRGYRWYRRMANGRQQYISRDDLLIFQRVGMRELTPGTYAAQATRLAAEILYGADLTLAQLYRTGNVPPAIISVPPDTSPTDKEEIERRWKRVLNPSKWFATDRPVIAVNQDREGRAIKIDFLSLTPAATEMTSSVDSRIHAILATHGVPYSIGWGDASNRATLQDDIKQIVSEMAAVFNEIAARLNGDVDMKAAGLTLEVMEERHPALRSSLEQPAAVFSTLVQSGMNPLAAAHLAGLPLDDLPADVVAFNDTPPPPTDTLAVDDEAARLKRWLSNRQQNGKPLDLSAFKTKRLTDRDKRLVWLEWKEGAADEADDAPFPGESDIYP